MGGDFQQVRQPEERDSFDIVRELLQEMSEGRLEIRKLREGEADVFVILKRLEKVHALGRPYKSIELSEPMRQLIRALGVRKVARRFPFLSKAASLL